MTEEELIGKVASKGINQVATRIFSGLGIILRAGQDRRNLTADVDAIKQLKERGLIGDYSGLSMEFTPYSHALEEEENRIVTNAANTLLKAEPQIDWEKADVDNLNPEFTRRWVNEASNVSDETLQQLWARLLKGELEAPGSVSNDTMTVARDMTKERAEEFQILCSVALYDGETPTIVVGCGNPGKDSLRPYGLSYDVLMKLAHHRLISSEMSSGENFSSASSRAIAILNHQGKTWALRWSTSSDSPSTTRLMSGILFTPAGEELSRVVERIPVPEFTQAMFEHLNGAGWTVIPFPPPSEAHNS